MQALASNKTKLNSNKLHEIKTKVEAFGNKAGDRAAIEMIYLSPLNTPNKLGPIKRWYLIWEKLFMLRPVEMK